MQLVLVLVKYVNCLLLELPGLRCSFHWLFHWFRWHFEEFRLCLFLGLFAKRIVVDLRIASILKRVELLLLQRFRLALFGLLPCQSGTGDILTIPLLDDLLVVLVFEQILEMPQTAVHVDVVGY